MALATLKLDAPIFGSVSYFSRLVEAESRIKWVEKLGQYEKTETVIANISLKKSLSQTQNLDATKSCSSHSLTKENQSPKSGSSTSSLPDLSSLSLPLLIFK